MKIKKIISALLVILMSATIMILPFSVSANSTVYGEVTYSYDLKLPEAVEDFQAVLTFDAQKYQVASDDEGNYKVSFPAFGEDIFYKVKNESGKILFNASNYSQKYDFTNKATVVTVTFDVISSNVENNSVATLNIVETSSEEGNTYSTDEENGTLITDNELSGKISDVSDSLIGFSFLGASIHLIEPWEMIFGEYVSASALALSDDYGAVVMHENNYSSDMTGEDMYSDENAIILSKTNGKSQIVNGSYLFNTLSQGLYCYDMDTDYYVSSFVIIDGKKYFDSVSVRNYLERIQSCISTEQNETNLAVYNDMYDLYVADINYLNSIGYTTSTVPKENRKTLHGSDYTMNGQEKTNTFSMIFGGASIHLVEPWGLIFAEAIKTSEISNSDEYGFVILNEKDFEDGMTGTDMMNNAKSCIYSNAYDSENYITPELYMTYGDYTYFTACQIENVYTYMMNENFYGKFYIVKDGNYYFSDTFSRSVMDRIEALKDSTSIGSADKQLYNVMYTMFFDAYKLQYNKEYIK